MVKRPKSPSTVQDTRLYTIVNPFPLYANWALEEDQLKCYYWIFACVRDRNAICSVLEKPSSRNMIIVELSKSFTDRAKFLGEHKWSQFLKKPTDQERPRATQVFDSRMSTFRDAEKAGWKPFKISPDEAFGPNVTKASIFRSPYPPTSWCAPPPEEKTGEPLCRPLPKDTKPPPPAPLPPVPGSTKWVSLQKPATAEPEPAPSPTPVISPPPQPPVPKDDEPWPTPKGTAALDFPALPDAIPARQSRFVPLNKPKANGNGNGGSGSGGGFSKVNANSNGSGAVATSASKVSKNKPVSLNTLHNTRPSAPAPKHKAPTSSPWNKTPWQAPSNNSSAPAAPRNLDPSWEKPNSKNAWAKRPTIIPDPKPSTANAIPRRERLDPNGHLWDVPDQELYSRFEELKVGDAAATSNGSRDDAAPKIDFESKAAISWADCADAEYPLEPYSATVEEVTPADAYAYDDEDDEEDSGTQPWQILASAVHAAPDSFVESADTTTDAGDSGADDGWTNAPTTSRGSRRYQSNVNGGISSRRGSSNAYDEEEPPLVCPTHKALCSAGICKDYSKAKRARERERAFQKRGGGKCGNGNRAQSRLRAGALAANDGSSA